MSETARDTSASSAPPRGRRVRPDDPELAEVKRNYADALARVATLEAELANREVDAARTVRELERQNAMVRKVFGRYVNDDVADTILESPRGFTPGVGRKRLTLLFADLRGFSSVCEQLPPEDVVRLLNIYLGAMAEVIGVWQGTLVDFLGDSIQAVFGLSGPSPDDAERAIACAIAMQNAMADVNASCKLAGLPAIEMGIGVHTGEVVVGSVGSRRRLKFGLVGSAANLASRVESVTVGGQVLTSESTVRELSGRVQVRAPFDLLAKGYRAPVRVYEVEGLLGRYALALRQENDTVIELQRPLTVVATVLEGKAAGGDVRTGLLLRLSHRRAELEVEPVPLLRQDLRLDVFGEASYEAIYGRVVGIDERGRATVRFTSTPPSLLALLTRTGVMRK